MFYILNVLLKGTHLISFANDNLYIILQHSGSHMALPTNGSQHTHLHHYNTLPKMTLYQREEGDGAVVPDDFSSGSKTSQGSPAMSQLPPLPTHQPPGRYRT